MANKLKKWLPLTCGLAILIGVLGVMVNALSNILSDDTPKKVVHQITLVQPPPPPPPPPKVQEKPPEPQMKEEVKINEPEPEPQEEASDEPPPGEDLGVDAEGGTGSDGFGLRGKKGGRGLIGGNGGSRFAWYANAIQRSIYDVLAKDREVRSHSFSINLKLWLSPTGQIQRIEIANTSGKPKVDEAIRLALNGSKILEQGLPQDLPQPIRLRINSRA